jgi:hypothetical protein
MNHRPLFNESAVTRVSAQAEGSKQTKWSCRNTTIFQLRGTV